MKSSKKRKSSISEAPALGTTMLSTLSLVDQKDSLGFVLRLHLQVENALENFIDAVLVNPEELGRLDYSARVRLALACGLQADLKPSLNALGALRNRFVHRIGVALTNEETSRFVATLPANIKSLYDYEYKNLKGKGASNNYKIGFCIWMLWTAVYKATDNQYRSSQARPHSK
jgi:hypothetical protein